MNEGRHKACPYGGLCEKECGVSEGRHKACPYVVVVGEGVER